jgi:hypothetical protein
VVGFAWIGLALASVNMSAHGKQESSELFITAIIVFEEYHHFVNHGVKESFLLICHGLGKFCIGFAWISFCLISQ